jgi:membrane protease YdiL (CAAX protease family)
MQSTDVRPAGWYPWGDDAMRWWDGAMWTPHLARRAQPARPPRPPHPSHPLPYALGALLVILVSLVASRYALDWLVRFHWPIAVYVLLTGVVGYGPVLAFCVWGSKRWGRGRFRDDSGLYFRGVDAGWGPVTWLSCVGAEIVVGIVVVVLHIPITSNTEGVNDIGADRGYVIALLILAVVAAPIIEEIVFRGVVLRGLLAHMGPTGAIAVQAMVFGMAHFDPVRGSGNIGLIMVLSSVGAVLGGAAYMFRRIGPTIVAHAILNAIAMTLALTGWANR